MLAHQKRFLVTLREVGQLENVDMVFYASSVSALVEGIQKQLPKYRLIKVSQN